MNSFTSALRPGPLGCSLALLLVVATAFPTSAPVREDSNTKASPDKTLTPPGRTIESIRSILETIKELRKEMCDHDVNCMNRKEALAEVNLHLPRLIEEDGCFPPAVNNETCLLRITSGLMEFRMYLEHLQAKFRSDEENTRVSMVLKNIQHLIKTLRPKVKNLNEEATLKPAVAVSLMENLQQKNQWLKTTTIHFILRGLTNFLEFTLRAVDLMECGCPCLRNFMGSASHGQNTPSCPLDT
ncbi:interleukin-6 precursor [Oryctolagus cuniculus]|uniref:Interleukin-6 n=4 Tax=Oryctolagus cuniculus TaxID=9986 RepID=IL6_RABIT|nr:interleukin-6 precursor [Oryctolagus cuniculus]Q9MZR1.1 RecName: Full=Interleukin-6; Short=IL-6; Flags: Precursor [Oryctolagus cuniculus]AII00602.1 interleukin 6 [Oryctolagus cuniculus cuniculus]AII00604.1 interleukin 6 [Oryctolagus cuniculus algirus]AAF86660.1 interleukin 6 [Oryctolagus cuniculus]ABG73600.1 IL-6 [Oryctolagus cuniculus]ABL76067.1 interleukin 6 [Oryctolagus cuniculus]